MDVSAGDHLGPLLIGAFFNCILLGVLLVQVHSYFQSYKKTDSKWNRYLVVYVSLVEIVNTVGTCGIAYEPLITFFGSKDSMLIVPTWLASDAIITAAISTPVQLYFGWRVRRTTGSNVLFGIIVALVLSSTVGAFGTTLQTTRHRFFNEFNDFRWAVSLWLISSLVVDTVISVALVWFLRNNRSGLPGDSVVNKIIRLTVQTGAITSIAALMDVVIFMTTQTTIMFIWDFALAKFYGICLLSILNARVGWNDMIDVERKGADIAFVDMDQLQLDFSKLNRVESNTSSLV